MQYSICSYSFRRDFEAGTMDIDGYIHWNKENGFTQLDPWMKHLEEGYAVGLAADTFLTLLSGKRKEMR